MTVDLRDLVSQFREANDRESESAYFRTHVPWVAPLAYFNIIYKPALGDVLREAISRLDIPPVFAQFLAVQNGAILFSGALSIYGVLRPGQLLNRSEPFSLPPFDIDDENLNWPSCDPERFLAIAGYGFDGSRVCIDRRNLDIHLFQRGERELKRTPAANWKDLDGWLTSEVVRLSCLFDHEGHRLTNEAETLPETRRPS
jgi:hypothetical protein